jgi:hypothetical protein
VRADDRPEQRLDLDLGLRADPCGRLAQRLEAVRRVRVRDPDLQRRPVGSARLEPVLELEERLVRTADALERDDLPVLDPEDRLDAARRGPSGGRRPTTPAYFAKFWAGGVRELLAVGLLPHLTLPGRSFLFAQARAPRRRHPIPAGW